MTDVYVVLDSYHSEDPYDNPDESEWYRPNTYTSHSVKGISLDRPTYGSGYQYESLTVDFDIDINKAYYLVYATYSTGDSFGYDEGKGFEGIALYEDKIKAEECRVAHENNSGKKTFLLENGIKAPVYRPWDGYFERLDYLGVEIVRVV
ncbi:MAG: hypothetical protein ACYSWS_05930 [Planctomycetota bacterium]|jgi:hypothetical protein